MLTSATQCVLYALRSARPDGEALVRAHLTPIRADARATWLRWYVRVNTHAGRYLAGMAREMRERRLRYADVDWRALIATFCGRSAPEAFLDRILAGDVEVRLCSVIERFEIVPNGTPADVSPDVHGYVSYIPDEDDIYNDRLTYVEAGDEELNLDDDRVVPDVEEVFGILLDLCRDTSTRRR